MVEGLLIALIKEHDMRPEECLALGTVDARAHLEDVQVAFEGLNVEFLFFQRALGASYFENVAMDFVYWVVPHILVFGHLLQLSLGVEVVNVLSHNAHLLAL